MGFASSINVDVEELHLQLETGRTTLAYSLGYGKLLCQLAIDIHTCSNSRGKEFGHSNEFNRETKPFQHLKQKY
jgi:hypothetical protein